LIQVDSPRRKRRRRRSHGTRLTPPQLARQLGVSPDKIVGWIRSGELRAVNIAANPKGRPRYIIDPKDVEAFEARRSIHKTPSVPRRRKRTSDDVIEFF
jgi:excisionase family DNA binding protein